jgi:hypothetical protein
MLSVWATKKAVRAALTAALVPGVVDLVGPGRPVEVVPTNQPRRIFIGNVANDTPQPIQEPGSQIRVEQYAIPLLIDCVSFTGNALEGHDTAADLVQTVVTAIEGCLAADPSWGGAVHESGLALVAENTTPLVDQPGGSGWRSGAILELHVLRRGV